MKKRAESAVMSIIIVFAVLAVPKAKGMVKRLEEEQKCRSNNAEILPHLLPEKIYQRPSNDYSMGDTIIECTDRMVIEKTMEFLNSLKVFCW